jgi:hypothetical protein
MLQRELLLLLLLLQHAELELLELVPAARTSRVAAAMRLAGVGAVSCIGQPPVAWQRCQAGLSTSKACGILRCC